MVRIPITNLVRGGDFTGEFQLGPSEKTVRLLLDTGSSSVAINLADFPDPVTPTNYARHLAYGSVPEGFNGPVVKTLLCAGTANSKVGLEDSDIVVIPDSAGRPFGNADGILGLAYKALNSAYDGGMNTYDYYIKGIGTPAGSHRRVELPTWFTRLEEAGLVANKFAFYTLRSYSHFGTGDPASDPLNKGYLILGGGKEATDLYAGEFVAVKVLHDVYYNTHLSAISVGDQRIEVPLNYPGQVSNSIIDTGTNGIALPQCLFCKAVEAFAAHNAGFKTAIESGVVTGLNGWPDVRLEMQGKSGPVELGIAPETYWQLNATTSGQAAFAIRSGAPLAILGLPLMNNYYTVFDRGANDGKGLIEFAPIKQP